MQYSTHFELIGASSLDDHGRFVYQHYIGDVPMHTHPDFASALQTLICEQRIDAIFPTMDAVAETLHGLAEQLGVRVIGSCAATSAICASKSKTYAALKHCIPVPTPYHSLDEIEQYPVFLKPDKGYGSHGQLRFHGPRTRSRIKAGISVHTRPTSMFAEEFAQWAEQINQTLNPRGAWFFQAKVDRHGKPKLLEVAVRLAGSSALFRAKGVNFALLSAFDAFDQDVEILVNDFDIEMDRALTNRFKTDLNYTDVFVDLDDTLIVNGKVNHELVAFLYQNINDGKRISLITRRAGDLDATLSKFRLAQIFDRVIHITDGSSKADYIDVERAVFIDDSFAEIKSAHKIKEIKLNTRRFLDPSATLLMN